MLLILYNLLSFLLGFCCSLVTETKLYRVKEYSPLPKYFFCLFAVVCCNFQNKFAYNGRGLKRFSDDLHRTSITSLQLSANINLRKNLDIESFWFCILIPDIVCSHKVQFFLKIIFDIALSVLLNTSESVKQCWIFPPSLLPVSTWMKRWA